MMDPRHIARRRFEALDTHPAVAVREPEYRRLLGYPRHHVPGERADELAAWARRSYSEFGRPWVYMREVGLGVGDGTLLLDGREFGSRQLHDHLVEAGAVSAVLVAASAGIGCEEHARRLWEDSRPDEYFFLEVFGSAVVEELVATTSGRICDAAERDGLLAVPHYSPGYTGWDIADQERLFDLITRGMAQPLPEPVEVLNGGMLRPKKSILAVFGLTARTERALGSARMVPCTACSFSPCQYRRAPHRDAPPAAGGPTPALPRASGVASRPGIAAGARYSVNARALRKWAGERVRFERREGGSIEARFHFDGTTCSSLGRPLAFDYTVVLGAPEDGCTILSEDCSPAPGDEGHRHMCAFLSDGPSLMNAISNEKPLLGRRLDDVLGWERPAAPSGCYCDAASRAHKWGLALEAIHYALAHDQAAAPFHASAEAVSNPP